MAMINKLMSLLIRRYSIDYFMCDAMGVREGETALFVLVGLRMKCGRLFQLGPKTCYTLCHQHQQLLKLGQMKCRIGRRRENVEKEKATSNEMK